MSCDALEVGGGGHRRGAGVHRRCRPASPASRRPGACATRPRASTGKNETFGADGGVDGGAQLRLVVDAVQPQAAGEVDQRLLLVELAEHLDGGLQRGQLAVGVEDVELAVVLAEARRSIDGVSGIVSRSSPTIIVSRVDSRRSRSSVKSWWTVTAPPA